ncbi:MAG: protein kinase domain-containing protein, partial [Vicinamibacteria bacterium]
MGPYEVLALVGAGGQGEVYRGRDTRIDRIVAIKVLASEVSETREHRERFEREARLIGSLSHPHICTLFDVGEHDGSRFLVMEYLEGETLADRIGRGALPMEQLLRYAVEISDALSQAHRRDIIHRDLKPRNVLLTKSGAKIVDFGIAKHRPPEDLAGLSSAPTRERDLTGEGLAVGTIQYMAPEQLEGREADARTDLFAFGEILYEMATGKKAFEGTSQASLIAAILRAEPPPLSSIQPMTPPAVERVVRKCLKKDPDERWQTAVDLKDELRWLAEEGIEVTARVTSIATGKRLLGYLAASIAAASLTGIVVWSLGRGSTQPGAVTLTEIRIPAGELALYELPALAISPDGRRLAYVGRDGEGSRIYVRELDRLEPRAVAGTEGGIGPFFSPDGEWLGFFTASELRKVSLRGGAPVTVYRGVTGARGASWGADDRIVFVPDNVSG